MTPEQTKSPARAPAGHGYSIVAQRADGAPRVVREPLAGCPHARRKQLGQIEREHARNAVDADANDHDQGASQDGELADVAPKDAADTGLDKPIAIDATTLEGLSYAIKVGKLAGDNYYVSFTSSGNHKAEDKAAREKMLSQHVLLIPKSKLEDTLKPRAELLEKSPQKK